MKTKDPWVGKLIWLVLCGSIGVPAKVIKKQWYGYKVLYRVGKNTGRRNCFYANHEPCVNFVARNI